MERKWPEVEYGDPFEFFLALTTPTRIGPHPFETLLYDLQQHDSHGP